jgi:uncharacterized damage-inducible protein DinB
VISPGHARLMAHYNRWQNQSLFAAASGLSDEARRMERGAFFGSIHGTLNHLLWADGMWMHRFTGSEKPPGAISDSPRLTHDWDDLTARRVSLDGDIVLWAEGLRQDWLDGTTTWTASSSNRVSSRPNWLLATHFFNHQTHHRGQTHAMLTAAGAKPEATDIIFMEGL